jgi:hypothetical protein
MKLVYKGVREIEISKQERVDSTAEWVGEVAVSCTFLGQLPPGSSHLCVEY